jgi:hypothetical protein
MLTWLWISPSARESSVRSVPLNLDSQASFPMKLFAHSHPTNWSWCLVNQTKTGHTIVLSFLESSNTSSRGLCESGPWF